jgi:hypothetical protein
MLFTVREIFLNKFSLSTYNKQYQENPPQKSSSIFNKFLYFPSGDKGKGMGGKG